MYAEQRRRSVWPWATTLVIGATALVTGAQSVFPMLLSHLERRPDMWSTHQYWRLVSPLFVHSGGWKQIAFNFSAIACVGYGVERMYGRRFWLICYFLSGVLGELFAYAWQPAGAGASIAGAGLLGALATFGLVCLSAPQVKFGALLVLLGSVVLTGIRDIHGPPVLLGAFLALVKIRSDLMDAKIARREEAD